MFEKIVKGSVAGVLGGFVFGLWMSGQGILPMIAKLVGGSSASLGFGLHLVISAAIGASFAVLFSAKVEGPATGILWGTVYGFVWWFLGPLTLMPLGLGMGLQWTASAVAGTIPSLLWHVAFGGIAGIAYVALSGEITRQYKSASA
ncbi:MAG: hypothetical protein ACE5IM_13785 [Nitrospinota bacterium]